MSEPTRSKASPGVDHIHSRLRRRVFATMRDTWNRATHGPLAPRFAELLWVDPQEVKYYDLDFARRSRWNSARIVSDKWDNAGMESVALDPILKTSIARWVNNVDWDETGEVERMERAIAERGPLHGCRTREDILRRCHALDEVFNTVRRERRIRPQSELNRYAFRELGGIGMHIGPDGAPIRAGDGRHRFAMALILELQVIPVRVGLVHQSAIGRLPHLRANKADTPVVITATSQRTIIV